MSSTTAPLFTIMGATGHTGGKIARRLLAAGARIRAIGRNPDKLAELARPGAEVRAGDSRDSAFLAEAFRGADGAYTLLATDRQAPDYAARQHEEGEAIASALRQSGLRRVVALSSLGADLPSGTGVIVGLHAQEERLKAIDGIDLLLLRPVSFFENFYDALGMVKEAGVLADAVAPELPTPMIAADDIAEVAASALLARDWRGVAVRELLGQRDLSHAEVAQLLGQAIGRPDLPYVQLSEARLGEALIGAGLSPSFVALYLEMTRAFNTDRIGVQGRRNAGNTTATRFEDFVPALAEAYRAM
ncbi:NmrA family NAD(P)-binding protein [Variovorax sp. JS1663]|uniref:NmrA family NAD(P)-binding protein n=1 Tax=Variovorax sp. JS1663 TaxID=1851577 RepID=UPI000B342B23|nr:NAD(P)H-binding protein [Variovorax sp. JS1663]OUL98640.1 FMN-dependent NADH-azoreductase [Variovorax sp. JS1663]